MGGVQRGSGAKAEVTEWHTMTGADHEFRISTKGMSGPEVQKDAKGRFFYIVWRGSDPRMNRRAKLYLESAVEHVKPGQTLVFVVNGRAKDGLPCCATIKPIKDWHPA